jgi:hypothetical protein
MLTQNQREIESMIARAESFRMDEVMLRYAEDTGRSAKQVEEHVRELKRYLVMVAARGETLVMGGPVDELWHTWMLYSRSYVQFCEQVAGRYLHHQPGRGSMSAEEERNHWAAFKALYQEMFDASPPEEIWPGAYPTPVGSRDWWRRKLEKHSRGGKLHACLTINCDGADETTTEETVDITTCAGTNDGTEVTTCTN